MSRIMRLSSSSVAKSASLAWPQVNCFNMLSAWSRPARQGTHLPHDSECVNSTK